MYRRIFCSFLLLGTLLLGILHFSPLPVHEHLKEAQVLPMDLSASEDFIKLWNQAVAANLQEQHDFPSMFPICDACGAQVAGGGA